MIARLVGRSSPLCIAQKMMRAGCYMVTFTDFREIAEVCASSEVEFLKKIPCSPTQAMAAFVKEAYNLGNTYGWWRN